MIETFLRDLRRPNSFTYSSIAFAVSATAYARARRVSDKLGHAELANFDCRQKLVPISHAVRALIVVAFVSANCSSRLRSHDPIDGTMIVPSASKSALHLHNCVSIAISGIVVPVVIVWVVPVIRIRIEERETKRVDKDERSIIETVEATKAGCGV